MNIIDGYLYMGQYKNKYYWLQVWPFKGIIEVYDRTQGKVKKLKIRKNGTFRINGESLSIYALNG